MLKAGTTIVLTFVVVFALTLGGRVLWRHWHQGDAAIAFAAAVDSKVAALNLPKRTVELPTEKARRVRGAVKQGDFATADKIFAAVLASSHVENWRFYPFTDFIDGITDLEDPAFATGLDAWVAQDGSDAAARLLRARYDFEIAWAKRGHDFSNKTDTAKLDAYRTYTDKALADCDAAIRLDPANPYAYLLRLEILRGLGVSQKLVDAFQQATDKFPGYYPLYRRMLNSLQPKWGGSVPTMYAFVSRYAGGDDAKSPLKLLYVALYQDLLETTYTACDSVRDDKDKLAQCISSTMHDLVSPELEKAIPVAMQLYDHTDRYQFGVALDGILSKMLSWGGGETLTGALLEIAATSLHSNTELTPDKPVANNYVIDKLVAESWYRKGFYDNALTKGREALKDIDSTTFPSEAEKDVAIAGVLDYVASAYDHLGHVATSIAYDEAAMSLGDLTIEMNYVCYQYYRLKDYGDAIRLCTRAIDDGVDVMEAHYWRGATYRAKGDMDAALKDLTLVAESENDRRASAAIDMSMIYFGRNDNRGALDVLNRYAYLYDPNKVDKQSVAVAYNNRCYAYMELNEPKKALDDCTQSLKYGSIPDAYSKQLKLMKLLGST